MKIRADFVTNSSSSNFVIGLKGKITDEMYREIGERVVNSFCLGEPELHANASPEEIKKYFDEVYLEDDDPMAKEILEALEKNQDIYSGTVVYDEAEYELANIASIIIDTINELGENDATMIDTNLSY